MIATVPDHLLYLTMEKPINQSIDQSILQSKVNAAINQSINQPANELKRRFFYELPHVSWRRDLADGVQSSALKVTFRSILYSNSFCRARNPAMLRACRRWMCATSSLQSSSAGGPTVLPSTSMTPHRAAVPPRGRARWQSLPNATGRKFTGTCVRIGSVIVCWKFWRISRPLARSWIRLRRRVRRSTTLRLWSIVRRMPGSFSGRATFCRRSRISRWTWAKFRCRTVALRTSWRPSAVWG